jgi:cell division protein FtsQ
VLVRGDAIALPDSRRKPKRAKRRYDIALSTPGVEMRLPYIPSVRIGWRLLSFVLVIGLSYVLYHVWTSPEFRVESATVEGVVRFSEQDISNALLVRNKLIFEIKPGDLERQLLNTFPGLSSVSAKAGFPSRVTVTVEERTPVISWEQDSNVGWIDDQGIAFPPRGGEADLVEVAASAPPPVEPLLEAESAEKGAKFPRAVMSPQMVAVILSLNQHVPDGVQILYDADHGFGWRDPKGWAVYLGADDADILMKLSVYKAVVKRLRKDGLQPVLISVEHLHAPYYRLEQ